MEADSRIWAMRAGAEGVVAVGALGGLLAGMAMVGTEMIYGWASSAHTAWDAPMGIWAWIVGLNHFGRPGNHIGPIILGLGVHLAISIVVGVVFVAFLTAVRLRSALVAVAVGVGYGVVAWVITRYGLLPLRNSTKALFTTSMVSPQWVWWLAHGLLGLTLGTVYAAARRAQMRPLMQIPRRPEDKARVAA